jgi:hypothetical protein
MDHLSVALKNLVGEFGILSGHLVSVKTTSTESRVACRHGRLSGFPGEDRFAETFTLGHFRSHVSLRVAGVNLCCGRGSVLLGLEFHFRDLGILRGESVLALLLHDGDLLLLCGLLRCGLLGRLLLGLLLRCGLIGCGLLHLRLLGFGCLVFLFGWTELPLTSSEPC